jgi:hypothetical protein
MGNEDLDRLREMLANNADRRRGGSWRLLRRMAAVLGILRAVFSRKYRY